MLHFPRFRPHAVYRNWWERVWLFFPVRLFVLHLKKDLLLLGAWAMLFAYITGLLGEKYGIPTTFLFPEYFGRTSFWSYLLVGFSVGGFYTGFNLYTYTIHADRFPFLATLSRPFLKFSLNNALIPLAFTLTYMYCSARFQLTKELISPGDVALHLFGFLIGIAGFQLVAVGYFMRTNTDITRLQGSQPDPRADQRGPERQVSRAEQRQQQRLATRWMRQERRTPKWRVVTYLVPPFRIALARGIDHYDRQLLRQVIWQNHINGSIFEVVMVLSFLALGALGDLDLFAIPTAASAFLLATMIIMLLSAFTSWFKGWTVTVIVGVVLLLDGFSLHTDRFLADNRAYGMDYGGKPAAYAIGPVTEHAFNDSATASSLRQARATLDRWAERNRPLYADGHKPPLVIVSSSGGGLRAMLWTYRCLQLADSLVGGDLMDRTALISGSSGGLIGAAYYRQVDWLAGRTDTVDVRDRHHLDAMSEDILNPVAFSFVTNDLFLRYRRVKDGTHTYTRDRGYAFERRLNELTGNVLHHRLADLRQAEERAEMPLLVMSPTTINDGRRLLIASSPVGFLTDTRTSPFVTVDASPESVELSRFFRAQEADSLRLTSALRMGATFPYITPVVTLPSEPPMRVMDAGIRDNYGYRVTLQYLYMLRDWVRENTSGVVLLQLRDKQKVLDIRPVSGSLLGRLLDPARNVYRNVVRVQDQDYDLMLQQASGWMDFPVEVIDVELQHDEDDAISLSWHLTAVEKQHVLRAVSSPHNGRAFARLRELLRPERAELTGRPGDDAPPVPPTGPVRSAAAASPSAPGAR